MKPVYLLIGSGRLSTHFEAYLRLLGLPVLVWSRRNHLQADLIAKAEQATHILCLISDSAIESFLKENSNLFKEKTVAHMSGSLVSELAPSVHPLMTFRDSALYDLETYRSIPFVLEKDRKSISELLPGLPNSSFEIEPAQKPLYHALCVMSGNFTTLLWQKAFSDFESKLSLPHEILLPYLKQITRNLEQNPSGALTGPLARKDLATVQRHLQELEGDEFAMVYRGFAQATGMEV